MPVGAIATAARVGQLASVPGTVLAVLRLREDLACAAISKLHRSSCGRRLDGFVGLRGDQVTGVRGAVDA